MAKHPGRGGHAWRQVRAQVLATYDTCCLCGRRVDKTLRWPHPYSPSVEHRVSLKATRGLPPEQQRALALDPNLLGLAHLRCNTSKGARTHQRQGPKPSRNW